MYQDLYHPFPCFHFFCCLIFQTWCYVILKTLLVASLCCIVVTVKIPLFEADMHGSLYLWYSFVYGWKPMLQPILLIFWVSLTVCLCAGNVALVLGSIGWGDTVTSFDDVGGDGWIFVREGMWMTPCCHLLSVGRQWLQSCIGYSLALVWHLFVDCSFLCFCSSTWYHLDMSVIFCFCGVFPFS